MRMLRSFTVVTPCFNAGNRLLETIGSVLNQTVVVREEILLQYVIVDGGSTDGSIESARSLFGERLIVISEADRGMYDALSKGFKIATGEMHAYINAGDVYPPNAFETVMNIMDDTGAEWLSGGHFYCNERSQVISFRVPFRYTTKAIQCGLHGTLLPAVQQESTFWTARLTGELDLELLATYRLAGDHYMWTTFSGHTELYSAVAHIGGFTYHGNHLSGDRTGYRLEMSRHLTRQRASSLIIAYFEYLVWRMPDRVKFELNRKTLVRYRRLEGRWRTGK